MTGTRYEIWDEAINECVISNGDEFFVLDQWEILKEETTHQQKAWYGLYSVDGDEYTLLDTL